MFIKMSAAFLVTISRSRSYMNFIACSRSIFAFLKPWAGKSAWEIVLVGGLAARLGRGDEVADRGRADHDLVRGDPAPAVLGLAQRLGDDRANRLGDHRADHLLLGRRKHVHDAVDGFRRGTRMQRAEYEVPRL